MKNSSLIYIQVYDPTAVLGVELDSIKNERFWYMICCIFFNIHPINTFTREVSA